MEGVFLTCLLEACICLEELLSIHCFLPDKMKLYRFTDVLVYVIAMCHGT